MVNFWTKNKGFSLVELLVVMAIVGVLAAIGVPAYQNYLVRAKTSAAMVTVNNLANKLTEVYTKSPNFTSVTQMGLTPSVSNPLFSFQPTQPSEYLAPYVVAIAAGVDPGVSPSCPSTGIVAYLSNINPGKGVFTVDPTYQIYLVNVSNYFLPNNEVVQTCYFYTSDADTTVSITGCYNVANPTESDQFDDLIASLERC